MSILTWYIQSIPNHPGKMRMLRFLNGEKIMVRLKSKYGISMRGNWADATFRSAILGKYDDVHTIVKTLESGMAFIDIGANAGVFSLLASELVGDSGTVISFEPSQSNFRNLVVNLDEAGCQNVHPFPCAISRSSQLFGFTQGPTTHSGVSHLDESSPKKILALGGSTLNDFISIIVDGRSTIIKIDVEGAELEVLKGLGTDFLSSKNIKKLVVEIDAQLLSTFGANPQEVYALLKESGFTPTSTETASLHYNELFVRNN